MLVKIESWRDKSTGKKFKVAVAREHGKIVARRNVKGSNLKKQDFIDIFKRNRTFIENRSKNKLTNAVEYSVYRESNSYNANASPLAKPNFKGRYVVQGTLKVGRKRITIAASSLTLGLPLCETPKQCYDYAWRKFWGLVGKANGHRYDSDEGFAFQENVSNIRESWVYYKSR